MSGGLRLLDVVMLGDGFKLAAGIIGVEHPIFEKVFVLIPFLCIFIPCCDRFASHGGLAIVGFDIFATIWNVDGNWNGFSGEELWGRIGV